jgi:hypothetical protein
MTQRALADPDQVQRESLLLTAELLSACGIEITAGAPLVLRTRIPSPFGGPALPAAGTATLAGLDGRRGLALIVVRAAARPEDVQRLVDAMAATEAGQRLPPNARTSSRVSQVEEHVMDVRTGWPVNVLRSTRVEIGDDARRVDARLIVRNLGSP